MNNKFISSVWNFNGEDTGYLSHSFLRWYGKLVPQLVERLLQLYTEPGDEVLANFSGSGTVPLECLINDRNCLAIDANPLAILLSQVKIMNQDVGIEDFANYLKTLNFQKPQKLNDYEKKWFRLKQISDLKIIKHAIDVYEMTAQKKKFYYLALAAIVRRCSLVDARCINHIVLDAKKKNPDVLETYLSKLFEMQKVLKELKTKTKKGTKIEIKAGDATDLKGITDSKFNLVISHPPYVGNVDYTNITQLENYLLGYQYSEIRVNDISTNSLSKYLAAMQNVIKESARVTKPTGHIAVIIGDNRKQGNIQPAFAYLITYALEAGLQLRDVFIWHLSQKAGMSIKRHGNHIDHNYILVFRKLTV